MADLEAMVARLDVAGDAAGQLLDFSGKGLKLDNEADAREIIDEINACKNLRGLRLEGNTLGVDAAKGIAKALERHPEFQFALWKDLFTGRLKTEIPEALTFLGSGLMLAGAKLVELDLSDNAFGPIGVEAIQVLLKSNCCFQLEILRLNNNGLGIGGGKVLAEALLECHKLSSQHGTPLALRVFMCGRNRLENDGAKALAKFFSTAQTLEEVIMPQNGIYHEGIKALAQALAKNANLRLLNMNDNTFTQKGAVTMAQTISSLQRLEIVNFGDCLVRSEGAKAIASAVKEAHESLKELNLGFNEIDVEGAEHIVRAIQRKPGFVKLDLDGNYFGDEGCERLRSFFKETHDVLGSLSNDEGTDNEDDRDDDDDDDEDDDDGGEESSDVDNKEDVKNDDRGVAEEKEKEVAEEKLSSEFKKSTLLGSDSQQQIDVEEFLRCPTMANLVKLGKDRVALLVQESNESCRLDKLMETFFKVSACLSAEENVEAKTLVLRCADAVMCKAFQQADDDNLALLSNSLLVHLGLIKSEDKHFAPVKDLLGPLVILEHVVKQPYFSRVTKEILQLFLSRPNKAIAACGNAKHKLMQSLYQF